VIQNVMGVLPPALEIIFEMQKKKELKKITKKKNFLTYET